MAKTQKLSVPKQRHILDTAGRLFAELGYDRTSLKMISAACGISIGSIEHFFGPKPALAGAVYADLADGMSAALEQATMRHHYGVAEAVRSILRAYFKWGSENPMHRLLFSSLVDYAQKAPTSGDEVQPRIERILADWARPYSASMKLRSLTGSQLFAVIVAPAMASFDPAAMCPAGERETVDWPETLASIVIQSVIPAAQLKRGRLTTAEASPPNKRSEAYGDIAKKDSAPLAKQPIPEGDLFASILTKNTNRRT